MSPEEQDALIEDYAPIVWLHEDEAFWPTDCESIFHAATLWRKGQKAPVNPQPADFGDPVFTNNNKDLYFKFNGLDMADFTHHPAPLANTMTELGPAAVARVARELYGQKFSDQFTTPMFYARVTENVFVDKFANAPGLGHLGGMYTVVQYFFYHLFNDSWNLHESDWDATVEVFLRDKPEKPSRTYVIYHLHHNRWFCELRAGLEESVTVDDWCNDWNDPKLKKGGLVYAIHHHPFVFVACGSHGAYPTPGFSVHGARIPISNDLAADVDERVIGRHCLYPDIPLLQDSIAKSLAVSRPNGLRAPKYTPWKKHERLDNQPWLSFKGRWGTESARDFGGFDGPQNPIVQERLTNKRATDRLRKAYDDGYDGGGTHSVLLNWHGIRPVDG